jgi:O-antigen/teichoic acid export membrane protein
MTVVVSSLVYEINIGLRLLLGLAIIAASANRVAAAYYQSMQLFRPSLCVSESPVLFIALAALAIVVLKSYSAWIPCTIILMGYAISTTISWIKLTPYGQVYNETNLSIRWREAFSILGINGALLIMVQFERLIVPKVLTLEVLATFVVLMTVAGSPFRMLQLGTTFAMLPRFRSANSPKKLKKLLLVEGTLILCTALGVGIAVWFIAPIIVLWFLSEKYIISEALIMASIIVGFIKIVDAITSTAVTALGSSKELGILTGLGWAAIGISGLGAFIGGHWGLVGVIYGVGFGWFFRALIGTVFIGTYLFPTSRQMAKGSTL